MARNRKRAKERRGRRPQPTVPSTRAPDPIAHATPDAELAEAQMALGRPELSDEPAAGGEGTVSPVEPATQSSPFPGVFADSAQLEQGELAPDAASTLPAAPAQGGNRLINFLQGSWRELQRVQWPDRRAVMQATGVVIGFVIVAGVYLGVADWVAGKIVSLIIK